MMMICNDYKYTTSTNGRSNSNSLMKWLTDDEINEYSNSSRSKNAYLNASWKSKVGEGNAIWQCGLALIKKERKKAELKEGNEWSQRQAEAASQVCSCSYSLTSLTTLVFLCRSIEERTTIYLSMRRLMGRGRARRLRIRSIWTQMQSSPAVWVFRSLTFGGLAVAISKYLGT